MGLTAQDPALDRPKLPGWGKSWSVGWQEDPGAVPHPSLKGLALSGMRTEGWRAPGEVAEAPGLPASPEALQAKSGPSPLGTANNRGLLLHPSAAWPGSST